MKDFNADMSAVITTKRTTHKFIQLERHIFKFGEFMNARKTHNRPTKMYEKCFCCECKFKEEEMINFLVVSTKGNVFCCDKCAEKINIKE